MLSDNYGTLLPINELCSSSDSELCSTDVPGTSQLSVLSSLDTLDYSAPDVRKDMSSELRELVRDKYSNDPQAASGLIQRYLIAGTPVGWCVFTHLRVSRCYAQISADGANKFAILQEVLLWSRGIIKQPGEDCSHLCHNPLCCIAEHIVAEPAEKNQTRKGCLVWVPCPHPAVCGDKKYFLCRHEPYCVKFCEGYRDQAHFLAEGICSFC